MLKQTDKKNRIAEKKPPASALDRIVSNLTRAALGVEARTVADDELEQYAAKLIMREAAHSQGRSLLSSSGSRIEAVPQATRPTAVANKQYLASVIRRTDAHNDALREREALRPSGTQSDDDHDDYDNHHRHRHSSPEPRTKPTKPEKVSVKPPNTSLQATTTTPAPASQPPRIRGRGTKGPRILDKVFRQGYDPLLDLDNYDDKTSEWYVRHLEALQEDMAMKKRKPKRHALSSSSSSSDSDDDDGRRDASRSGVGSSQHRSTDKSKKKSKKDKKEKKEKKDKKHKKEKKDKKEKRS